MIFFAWIILVAFLQISFVFIGANKVFHPIFLIKTTEELSFLSPISLLSEIFSTHIFQLIESDFFSNPNSLFLPAPSIFLQYLSSAFPSKIFLIVFGASLISLFAYCEETEELIHCFLVLQLVTSSIYQTVKFILTLTWWNWEFVWAWVYEVKAVFMISSI